MTVTVHPTALVDAKAKLHEGVEIGPYAVIGPDVEIGENTRVGPHTVIAGLTTIGRDNVIYGQSSIGGQPQDKKYDGEPTALVIGDGNMIREFCTFNTGTVQDQGVTRIGNHNWFMAYVHIAHDCVVGNHTIFANNAQLAGHAHAGDWAVLGGVSGAHQFVRIGCHAMLGMGVKLMQDVLPYTLVAGTPYAPHGINAEGLKRRGFSPETIVRLKNAYKLIYRNGMRLDDAKLAIQADIDEGGDGVEHLQTLLDFLNTAERGFVR